MNSELFHYYLLHWRNVYTNWLLLKLHTVQEFQDLCRHSHHSLCHFLLDSIWSLSSILQVKKAPTLLAFLSIILSKLSYFISARKCSLSAFVSVHLITLYFVPASKSSRYSSASVIIAIRTLYLLLSHQKPLTDFASMSTNIKKCVEFCFISLNFNVHCSELHMYEM